LGELAQCWVVANLNGVSLPSPGQTEFREDENLNLQNLNAQRVQKSCISISPGITMSEWFSP
jgi:hypothetical protein